jgi:hypothetical protein
MAKTRGWGGSDRYRFALFSAPYSSFERVSFSGCTIVLFGAGTQAARNGNVSNPVECQLIGRWPIVEADLWDRAYLDLAGPAYLEIADKGWPSSPSVPSKRPPNSNTAARSCSSAEPVPTRGTRSPATDQPNNGDDAVLTGRE